MERCVSDGIYKKAGNEYTDVADCGRTFIIHDTTYRLELCGYFPTKHPKYIIMVVMEKMVYLRVLEVCVVHSLVKL